MRLEVQLAPDHLQRLSRSVPPHRAILEYIWNALDADATAVTVEVERSVPLLIDRFIIKDNGTGIPLNSLSAFFGQLGGSHKSGQSKTVGGRAMHGRRGVGRFLGFGVGSVVTWTSTYQDDSGVRWQYAIHGAGGSLKYFDVDEPVEAAGSPTGVVATISGLTDGAAQMDAEALATQLLHSLAPYLLAYGPTVTVDSVQLSPKRMIADEASLSVTTKDGKCGALLRLVRWNVGRFHELHLCSPLGISYVQDEPKWHLPHLSFSAYLMSDLFTDLEAKNLLEIGTLDHTVVELRDAARHVLQAYSRTHLAHEAARAVVDLKNQDIYPYRGEPADDVEQAERQIFDICAVMVHQYSPTFSESSTESKWLTLRLLREALERDPRNLRRILHEVLRLGPEDVDALADLLEKTSLSQIILIL